jgi:hypothetical protein
MTVFCRCPDSLARMIILGHLALTYAGLPRSVATIGCLWDTWRRRLRSQQPWWKQEGPVFQPFSQLSRPFWRELPRFLGHIPLGNMLTKVLKTKAFHSSLGPGGIVQKNQGLTDSTAWAHPLL